MCRKSLLPLFTLFFIFYGWCIPKTEAATLLYSNGFDGQFGDVTKMYDCQPHAYSLVTSPKKSGTHAIKFTSYGEERDMCWEWGNTTKKHRVQLQLGINNSYPGYPKGLRIYPNDVGPWWIGFSMYIPSNIPTGMFIIFDIKSGSSHFGEPTAFFHFNKLDVRLEGEIGNEPKFTLPRDQWVDVVWMIERRNDSTGKMKFWLNGKLALDQTGKTIPEDLPDVESWFRIGIYYGNEIRTDHTYITYFDDVKIAKGADGYNLVAPGGEAVPPPVEQPPGTPSEVKVSKSLSSAH